MKYVTAADGVKLAYDVAGEGPPLLCLPGLTRNIGGFRARGGRFRRPRHGHPHGFPLGGGASDFADPATYQVPQEAADVLVLLDQLGLDRVTILGTSRGGLVAMVLAATAKDRLSGVILNDVGPEIMTEGLSAIMTYIGKPPVYRTMAEAAEALPALYGDSFGGAFRPTHGPCSPDACSGRRVGGCTCAMTRACARRWRPLSRLMRWRPTSGRSSMRSRGCRSA